jgi:hypothetical protein
MASGDDLRADEIFLQALALDPDNVEIREEEVSAHKSSATLGLRANGDAHTAAGLLMLDAKLSAHDLQKNNNDVHARTDIAEFLDKAASKAYEADMQVTSEEVLQHYKHEKTGLLDKVLPGGRSADGSVAVWPGAWMRVILGHVLTAYQNSRPLSNRPRSLIAALLLSTGVAGEEEPVDVQGLAEALVRLLRVGRGGLLHRREGGEEEG